MVRALHLRRARRHDHLLRSAPADAALRGVLPAPPARAPPRALRVPAEAQPHDVRRPLLDRSRRRHLPRRSPRARAPLGRASSIASSACSTSSPSGGSSRWCSWRTGGRRPSRRLRPTTSSDKLCQPVPTGTGMVWARGAGGPSRSGKCGVVPSVPRAHPRRPGRLRSYPAPESPRIPCPDAPGTARRRPHGRGAGGRAASRAAGSRSRWPSREIDADRRHALEARLPGVRVAPSPGLGRGRRRGRGGRGQARRRGRRARELRSRPCREGALVLSIAAGVTLAALEAAAPGRPVVRAMPNTGALVGRGAAAIAAGALATELDLEVCERILGGVGTWCGCPRRSSTR